MARRKKQPLLEESELWNWISRMTDGDAVPVDDEQAPPWFEAGIVCAISQKMYFEFLELQPPRWRHASVFVCGEGDGPLYLFWRRKDLFFGREFTAEEMAEFRRLTEEVHA